MMKVVVPEINNMGKKNKVAKLTDRKIRYIIRAKKRGESTKRIAQDMKSTKSKIWAQDGWRGSSSSRMESISRITLFIRNCYLMAWPM